MEATQLKNNIKKNYPYFFTNEFIIGNVKNLKKCLLLILIIFALLIRNLILLKNKRKNFNLKVRDDISNNLILYTEEQNNFCINPGKYYNKEIEDKLELKQVIFKGLYFEMFVYKDNDIVSKTISIYRYFEPEETKNILKALKYYASNNNIKNNKDILILDIGGNIGWYPAILGRFGYSVLSFEPSPQNYYILRKNLCHLFKDSNVIIINKGLSDEEKDCYYYSDIDNIGNGMVVCDKIKNKEIKKEFKKTNEIISLTKLSNFIPYLLNKNLALIKIDIEGFEGKAIAGGIELINKYHIPYILMELTPRALIEQGTDPIDFLKIFVNNGYKIKIDGFFDEKIISVEEVVKTITELLNIYLVYER